MGINRETFAVDVRKVTDDAAELAAEELGAASKWTKLIRLGQMALRGSALPGPAAGGGNAGEVRVEVISQTVRKP